MKKQLLTILAIGSALTGFAQTTLLSESFTGQTQPAGWTNDSLGQANVWQWVFNNPNSRVISGAGFDTDFAILDSDFDGSSATELASLTTPAISTMGYAGVRLTFDEQFRFYSAEQIDLDYSIDGGTNWTSIRSSVTQIGYPTPVTSTFTLPANAGNVADLRIRFTYSGNWGWWWAIDNVLVEGLSSCAGTPVAGTISGCPTSICPNVAYDMMISGATGDAGITYQWLSSADGITYSPVTAATTTSLHDSTNAQIYYLAVVTCTASGLTDTTPVVSVDTINPFLNCYCAAVHPACAPPDFISMVSIDSTTLLNNDSLCNDTGNGAYSIYPATGNTTASLEQGMTYNFNVTTQEDNIISVWIDFDQSGTFDASEWTQICTTSTANVVNAMPITVPANAMTGLTGMRVRSRLSGNTNDANSGCLVMGSGECEDYFVTIIAPTGIKSNVAPQFAMYPNPAQNAVTLKLTNGQMGSVVNVIDVLGNKVIAGTVANENTLTLDVKQLVNGVYFVSIENEAGSTVKRLVISK